MLEPVLEVIKGVPITYDERQEKRIVAGLQKEGIHTSVDDFGMECITEGVETARQVELLRSNGCRFAQGFHFDKPLPVVEFEKRLDQRFYSER